MFLAFLSLSCGGERVVNYVYWARGPSQLPSRRVAVCTRELQSRRFSHVTFSCDASIYRFMRGCVPAGAACEKRAPGMLLSISFAVR